MNPIEKKASEFARAAHERVGQLRKYTNAPYWEHPAAVAEIVRSVPHDVEMLAAAWLHDTVEDTGVTFHDLQREFGPDIAMLVCDLTDISEPSDGDRATRKAMDRAHAKNASPRAKTVKLADIIDNSSTIVRYDPEFARVYLPEKLLLLDVLSEGDSQLWWRARAIAEEGCRKLKIKLDPLGRPAAGGFEPPTPRRTR